MTPQDKAKQIIEMYESGLTIKDCALIAVDLNTNSFRCPPLAK
jgi:hypothetical protein